MKLEDMYQEGGEINDQIQSYKEQLIDAKLKNIKSKIIILSYLHFFYYLY